MIFPPLAANAGFGGLGGDELGADQEGAIQQSSGPPFTLSQNIPNAQLIIYPDAGHGALFQVPKLFVAHAEMFLDA
jgi:pimeloyl-ACP methyl ester carboxylesterase